MPVTTRSQKKKEYERLITERLEAKLQEKRLEKKKLEDERVEDERVEKKQLAMEAVERVEKSKKLQKNVRFVEDNPEEAARCRANHKKRLDTCLNDPSNLYRCPTSPIFEFFLLNERIQETGNPWLINKEGYSPSSYTYEILDRHFPCLQAWREWRGNVPDQSELPLFVYLNNNKVF